MQKRIVNIIKSLSEKYSLPEEVITEIFNSQWHCVKDEIKTLSFKTIKLSSFGKFIPSKKKLKILDYSNKLNRKWGKKEKKEK